MAPSFPTNFAKKADAFLFRRDVPRLHFPSHFSPSLPSSTLVPNMSVAAGKMRENPTKQPAQHAQPSRKGKKAWRKNVDIGNVEDGLEEMRTEERVLGSTVKSKTNEELFTIDLTGDEKIRRIVPKFDKSQLSYAKLIAQRSAISAVTSRPAPSKKRKLVTKEDKARLLAIAKRKRLGPLGTIIDSTEIGQGSASFAPSHAAIESGKYDVWDEGVNDDGKEEVFEVANTDIRKVPVNPPRLPNPRSKIQVPAIAAPHAGTSYNPSADAHTALVLAAGEECVKELKESERYVGVKEQAEEVRKAKPEMWEKERDGQVMMGMKVDLPGGGAMEDAEEEEEEGEEKLEALTPAKIPIRKTKQQRKKALLQKAEKRAILERKHKKLLQAQLAPSSLSSTLRTLRYKQAQSAARRAERAAGAEQRIKEHGMAGTKVGRHRVPEPAVEVQTGEELSESLRGLKVEGNLFKDRYLSMQQRALVEPRVPVLPKRHKVKTKEVEKHAWKRFDRE